MTAESNRTTANPLNRSVTDGREMVPEHGVEFGVPAVIGARVFDADGPTGIITGTTDEFVVYVDDETGETRRQTYGFCSATLRPPVKGVTNGR